jgi:TM2 domain-containing membrane protein YozV
VLILFVIGFLIGLVIYWLTRKVRFDELYLGGNSPLEQFRVVGTEFYNEVRNMQPLKSLYNWAEKKYFDIYDLGANSTFAFSHLLQKAHPGQLQLYLLYIIVGLLIFIALVH